jgi:hypothetical protein
VLVAVLLFLFVSAVVEATVAVSVMIVPPAVPVFTLKTAVTVAVAPGGTLELEQDTGAEFGHVQEPPPVTPTDTKAVLAGAASVKVALLQLLGPELAMTCVYVMLLPAETGFGAPLLVTDRSHWSAMNVETLVLLFEELGSLVDEVTDELAVIVPCGAVAGTFTTTMTSASVPVVMDGSVQFTVPVLPTAGAVQLQPAGASTDSKVVLVGVASLKLTAEAEAGPLFVIACV